MRSAEDEKLLKHLAKHKIHLEVCPTSNVQTNVFDIMEQHTADNIYKAGVSMSINTDARTISDTNLAKEYEILERLFGWGKGHILRCNLEAVEYAFTTEAKKKTLRSKLLEAY